MPRYTPQLRIPKTYKNNENTMKQIITQLGVPRQFTPKPTNNKYSYNTAIIIGIIIGILIAIIIIIFTYIIIAINAIIIIECSTHTLSVTLFLQSSKL